MSEPYTVILDAPTKPLSRIQIAKLGDFNDPRYGDFSITRDNVTNWQRHLSKLPGGETLIDFEHRSELKPRDSKAAGWISSIDLDGEKVMADARWTPLGEQAIKDELYRFLSPVYGRTSIEGETLDDALPSVALTNKPFLGTMPAVCLASEETLAAAAAELEHDNATRLLDALSSKQRDNLPQSAFAIPEDRDYPIHDLSHARNALARSSGKPEESRVKAAVYKRYPNLEPAADTRRRMDTEVLKALDLGTDADDTKVLEAIAALRERADKPPQPEPQPEPKTLEQQAAEDGKVILDAERLTTLMADAKAGADAKAELHEQRFETAFTRALEHSDGAKVAPAEKDDLHALYQLDADRVLKMIDERDPIVQAKPQGSAAVQLDADADPEQLVAAGVHPGNHQLHQEVLKRLHDEGKPMSDYPKLLSQLVGVEL